MLGLRWSTEVVDGERRPGCRWAYGKEEKALARIWWRRPEGLGGSGCFVVERRKI